jgi:hypothetical protein
MGYSCNSGSYCAKKQRSREAEKQRSREAEKQRSEEEEQRRQGHTGMLLQSLRLPRKPQLHSMKPEA